MNKLRPLSAEVDINMVPLMRCLCGKIVCQASDDTVIIKCRNCKRYIIIYTNGIRGIEHK